MIFNLCGILLLISKQQFTEPESFCRVQWFCLVDQEGQKPGASISPTGPFGTLSMAERAAVMIVQLVKVWLVITVEPENSNVRLNTIDWGRTNSKTLLHWYFKKSHALYSDLLILELQYRPLWLHLLHAIILRSAAVKLGSMETCLSTHYRFWYHTCCHLPFCVKG